MSALIIILLIIIIYEASLTRNKLNDSIRNLKIEPTKTPVSNTPLSSLKPTLKDLHVIFIICGNCKKSFYSKDGTKCPHCSQVNPKNIYRYTNSLTTNKQRSNI